MTDKKQTFNFSIKKIELDGYNRVASIEFGEEARAWEIVEFMARYKIGENFISKEPKSDGTELKAYGTGSTWGLAINDTNVD